MDGNKIVYLSGPIAGQTDRQATGWRKDATRLLRDWDGVESLDPLRGKHDMFEPGRRIPQQVFRGDLSLPDVIVGRDLRDIVQADGLLVQVGCDPDEPPYPMTGTVVEVFASQYLGELATYKLPCVAFLAEGMTQHPQVQSPWFGEFFTPRYRVFPDLEEAVEFLMEVI